MRIVPELRAVHVERHRQGTPAELLFFATNYDLAGTEVPPGIRRTSLFGALWHFRSTAATTLEVPEPLWMRFWPKHAVLALGFRAAGFVRRRRHVVVTYAMENNDIATLVGGRRPVPRPLVRLVALVIGSVARLTLSRICFASPAAQHTYASLPGTAAIEHAVQLELPAPSDDDLPYPTGDCVFVGVLEERKGVLVLLRAWSMVETVVPAARLTLVGPGPLEAEARSWAAASPGSRAVLGRQNRTEAIKVLRRCAVLAAPSQPDGRWREQISLPIKEALAHGLTVVTTRQTGLADWLEAQGHHVLDDFGPGSEQQLALALARALQAPLDREAVRAPLPPSDGRLIADAWLHTPHGVSDNLRGTLA